MLQQKLTKHQPLPLQDTILQYKACPSTAIQAIVRFVSEWTLKALLIKLDGWRNTISLETVSNIGFSCYIPFFLFVKWLEPQPHGCNYENLPTWMPFVPFDNWTFHIVQESSASKHTMNHLPRFCSFGLWGPPSLEGSYWISTSLTGLDCIELSWRWVIDFHWEWFTPF